MGIGAAMEIGKNGLNIYRVATEVTSENIANVNTPGYSRQRVILETAPPTTANGFPMGTGVRIASVERYYDALLQKQIVNSETKLGYDTTKSTVLQQIEPTFNDVVTDGLGTAISDFFGAWQDLSLNPAGTAERQAVLTRAQIMIDNFKSVSTTLTDSITMQDESLVPLTSDINATLSNIAELNGQIKTTELVSGNANETRDRRDQLIRELSSKIGITFTENSDGTTDIAYADGGAALVTGTTAGSFSLTVNGGTGLYDVNLTPPAGVLAIVAPVTGELGATIALRDTIIPDYLTKIDTLAKSVADTVNAEHTNGFNLAGATGQDFFTPPGAVNGAAAGLSLAAGLTTNTIAASAALATLPGDNSNALAIARLVNAATTAGTTYNSYYTNLVSTIGLDVKAAKNTVAHAEAFTKQLNSLRESNSGVSLDEELTNLVKYQRSYQASAKLINTATEMIDTVIAMVR